MGSSRSISPSDASNYLTVRGDITEVETAQMIVEQAVARFGRIDSLINNAGLFISKPFTDYTLEDYLAITAVNLTGFFHITQEVIRQMLDSGHWWSHSQRHDEPCGPRREREPIGPCIAYQRWAGGRDALIGYRVRVARVCGSTQSPSES